MWPFKKQTLKQKRSSVRKKYLQQSISSLMERKTILEVEIEELNKKIEKASFDLKNLLKREPKDV